MSWLLAVQPDARQADALREALGPHIAEDLVVVVESVDHALSFIDQRVPDVILLPTLSPVAVEDYLIAYLATIPGAGHVQILGLPRLERADNSVSRRKKLIFPWRRSDTPPAVDTPVCDPDTFSQDVVAYLAGARALKREIELYRAQEALKGTRDRRREPRFASDEVPWISLVIFGDQPAALIDVSSRGALLRTHSRPRHRFLKRSELNVQDQPRLTLELEWGREVHAVGRVIRCIPLKTTERTQYEIAFSFDHSVGLHLPAVDALVPMSLT